MDLDVRKLRYFVAVAEHEHFGRAADQLYIAQPVLSRQIRALEQELGCDLLHRTTRRVQLTDAGRRLLDEARVLLPTVDAAVRRVREAAQERDRLVVGFAAGLRASEAVRLWSLAHPGIEVELRELKWWEPDAPLRDGRVHVAYVRRPFDERGIDVVSLGSEPRVACLPRSHPLACRAELTLDDLAAEPVLDAAARRTSTVEEKLELVAAGQGIARVPRSVWVSHARDDLVAIPVTDAPPAQICLALPADSRDEHVRDFVRVALEVNDASAGERVPA
ncbi:LysR family transcriptional regulator [Jatrophihabitans endophyticus]|uniref:LysR family transcriptional regulator n=1 Tax=Jatrophihabitans endophyticus TaxID=1206085 RepID=UPI0019F9ACF4|nr:LysR substrate-binding domain-containing protein [Jatrophihabitans endophyticus]MBE7187342.1 LysR family transcriptional regulator [Jatrophihabitans endophyticus]